MNRWLCSALVVTPMLVACGSTTTAPSWFVTTYSGAPSGVTLTDDTPVAVWAAADQLALVTWWVPHARSSPSLCRPSATH